MRLTRTTDFAIRVLAHLAREKNGSTMPILSERLGIPYNNLTKLVLVLSKAGLISTRKGKFGGVQLLRAAESITLKDVVDLIDGPTRLSECLDGQMSCGFHAQCKIKSALSSIQMRINTLMDDVTIEQLI